MQLVKFNMICSQYLQAPVKIAFEAVIVPRVAFACQKDATSIAHEHLSNHSFARTVAACRIPIADTLSQGRFEQRMAGIQVTFVAVHECAAQPETEN